LTTDAMCNKDDDPCILNVGDIMEKEVTDEKQETSVSSINACCFQRCLFLLTVVTQLVALRRRHNVRGGALILSSFQSVSCLTLNRTDFYLHHTVVSCAFILSFSFPCMARA
jgi:hypothetical protein